MSPYFKLRSTIIRHFYTQHEVYARNGQSSMIAFGMYLHAKRSVYGEAESERPYVGIAS